MTRTLTDLLPDQANLPDVALSSATLDSRKVVPGALFVAVPGASHDGRAFIEDAIANGAAAVLCEAPVPCGSFAAPVIEVPALSERLGDIAAAFYGEPSKEMLVVAVTGTNGKTSCSQFAAEALSLVGRPAGVIGTMGFGRPGELRHAGLTTPDPFTLQARLAELRDEGCVAVGLEASSHGLAQDRLQGTRVDTAIFTNLTRDHLDYHADEASYKAAKARLFTMPGLSTAILNIDDPFAEEIRSQLDAGVRCLTMSLTDRKADVYCRSVQTTAQGIAFQLHTPWGKHAVQTGLLGRFNVSNLLSTAALLGDQGHEIEVIAKTLGALSSVKGRMERLAGANVATVVIDYAHTPDALEKALAAVKEHCKGELWCVFGCGGDRDRGKRAEMGEIASRLANHVMITDDNPRGEFSRRIANDIVKGVVPGTDVEVVLDRAEAIHKVLLNAATRDAVLIAGKGHEEYQEVGGRRLPFSDHAVVSRTLAGLADF